MTKYNYGDLFRSNGGSIAMATGEDDLCVWLVNGHLTHGPATTTSESVFNIANSISGIAWQPIGNIKDMLFNISKDIWDSEHGKK